MKKVKYVLIAFGILLALGFINRLFNGEEIDKRNAERSQEAITSQKETEPSEYSSALAVIKKESKVKEAIITDAKVLYASVKDDGTNRKGYAEYLCQVLISNGVRDVRVKVVKIGSTNDPARDNAYGVLLGESDCRF